MLELDKMVDEGQDPAEGDDIQEATYPVDKSILEEEEIIEDYVKKQIDIEEQIESEYNWERTSRALLRKPHQHPVYYTK